MSNHQKKLPFTFKSILLFFGVLLSGCRQKNFDEYRSFYRAVTLKDTAILAIETHNDQFFGQYEIYYGSRAIKDSGSVQGFISGDTLRGKYRYRSYGGGINEVPIIFLKRNGKLIPGSGVAASYLNFVYYKPEYPIVFDSTGFIFKKIDPSEIK